MRVHLRTYCTVACLALPTFRGALDVEEECGDESDQNNLDTSVE